MRVILPAHVFALEQEQVGAPRQRPLDAHVERMQRAARRIVEAAAVRRVGAHRVRPVGKPRVDAALGAVAVHDVGPVCARKREKARNAKTSESLRVAGDRRGRDAERGAAGNAGDRRRARARRRRRNRRTARPRGRAPPARPRGRSHGETARRAARETHERPEGRPNSTRGSLRTRAGWGARRRRALGRLPKRSVRARSPCRRGGSERSAARSRSPAGRRHARQVDAALVAARREAAGDRHRRLRRHAVDERILARRSSTSPSTKNGRNASTSTDTLGSRR